MSHATHVSYNGETFVVTCSQGCDLGTSAVQAVATDADFRADLHEFAQTVLPRIEKENDNDWFFNWLGEE